MEPCEDTNRLIPVRLTAITYGAIDIHLFEFRPLDGAPLPSVAPGAHVELHLPNGMVRPYSLLTPFCDATRCVVGVKRQADGRGGSRWLHDQMKVGEVLKLGVPRNHFPLNDGATETVLLAGGIGITPIHAMYEKLRALGKPVRLHYWCRSSEHALFEESLRGDPQATLHRSDARASGGCSPIAAVLDDLPAQANVYCCGPRRMLDEVQTRLQGRAGIQLHFEHFHAAPATNDDAGESFELFLSRSGLTLPVPAGQTMLNVIRDAAVDVAYSCEEGVCGACETRVLAGTPLHKDTVYSEAEHARRGTVMICCSGSRSRRLVLDL
jgi:ferredoxin-NADP reductase